PADGEQNGTPWGGLEIEFSSPMDPDSITGNFTISPPVSETAVYTYWWDSDTQLEISFPIQPSSDYEVTIGGDVRGRYGHELGEDTTVRWHTRAYDPMVYLHNVGKIVTYDAYTETLAFVTVRNVGQVEFFLYRMPAADFMRANGRNSWDYWNNYGGSAENLVRQWTLDTNPLLNQRAIYGTRLAESEDGLLEPGLYYLKVRAVPDSIYHEARHNAPRLSKEMLVVSRHNLSLKTTGSESLIWATDLRSGDVLPARPIVVMSEGGGVLAEGMTDGDGVFSAEHDPVDRWSPIFAFAGDPENPGPDFAAAISGWDDGISAWEFDLPVEYYDSPFAGYLFTDRPIYRPGQTVYFKGVLRGDDDAHYSLPFAIKGSAATPSQDYKVHVEISGHDGKMLFDDDLSISDMGTLDGELALDEEAALGVYSIRANYLRDKEFHFYTSFQVAEYRKPEFQVEVETDRPEYVQGDEIDVTALATYFFGGPVADASVRYVVLSADYFFEYQGQGWWDFT
ncbi:MAG: MG2 domain-containing protein, partial [Chloroflexota bacterium]|nr:MG2 domain-containing protein [Chloroflexota bacterium]